MANRKLSLRQSGRAPAVRPALNGRKNPPTRENSRGAKGRSRRAQCLETQPVKSTSDSSNENSSTSSTETCSAMSNNPH